MAKLKNKTFIYTFLVLMILLMIGCYFFFSKYVILTSDVKDSVSEVLGDHLYYNKEDLRTVTKIVLNKNFGIKEFRDLEFFPNVTYLSISNGKYSGLELSKLECFRKLDTLFIYSSDQKDFSFLSCCENLKVLVYVTQIFPMDLNGIEKLGKLQKLGLAVSELSNISKMSHLTNLEELWISYATFKDKSEAIGQLKNLKDLGMAQCNVGDITFINSMTGLERISFSKCKITGTPSMNNLANIKTFNMNFPVSIDISKMGNSTSLERLNLVGLGITEVEFLKGYPNLKRLDLSHNNIVDVDVLSELDQLTHIDFYNNNIVDIDTLFELDELTFINLDNNPISDQERLQELYRTVEERAKAEKTKSNP